MSKVESPKEHQLEKSRDTFCMTKGPVLPELLGFYGRPEWAPMAEKYFTTRKAIECLWKGRRGSLGGQKERQKKLLKVLKRNLSFGRWSPLEGPKEYHWKTGEISSARVSIE